MKIDKLTPEQEAERLRFRDLWIARAIRSDWNSDDAAAAIPAIYQKAGLAPPRHVVTVDDPKSAAAEIRKLHWKYVQRRPDFEKSGSRESTLKKYGMWNNPPHDGAGWCSWRATYDFYYHTFGLAEELQPYIQLDYAGAFWYWFYEEAAILCGPPKMSFLNQNLDGSERFVLHRDGGPALEWPSTKLYYLNGVEVESWLAETPAEALDPLQFAKIDNVEVRREFVRKLGVERLCQKLGSECIDKSEDGVYELHSVDLGGQTGKWPYLKMLNPSIGCWHMEAVSEDCRTVADALTFRNGTTVRPKELT